MDVLKSQVTGERMVRVLYLDLDGTVREGKDDRLGSFVNGPEDVVIFPAARAAMLRWREGGGRIIGVTNQGGVALGHVSMTDCVAAIVETNRKCDHLFDKIAACFHHPAASVPEMAVCWCRKPRPGLVIEAANELAARTGEIYPPHLALFVGDRPEDQRCAEAAGIPFLDAVVWRMRSSSGVDPYVVE